MSFSHLYGPEWENTKRKYWATSGRPWRRKRCVWCRRGNRIQPGRVRLWKLRSGRGGQLQVHHLTYIFGYGDAPLFVLRPMCPACHHIETALTRLLFGEGFNRRSRIAHVWVTYGVRWCINLSVLLPVLYLAYRVWGPF